MASNSGRILQNTVDYYPLQRVSGQVLFDSPLHYILLQFYEMSVKI